MDSLSLGKPQKNNVFLVAGPLRGGGGKGLATKKKYLFWSSKNLEKKFMATKLEGGGG